MRINRLMFHKGPACIFFFISPAPCLSLGAAKFMPVLRVAVRQPAWRNDLLSYAERAGFKAISE